MIAPRWRRALLIAAGIAVVLLPPACRRAAGPDADERLRTPARPAGYTPVRPPPTRTLRPGEPTPPLELPG